MDPETTGKIVLLIYCVAGLPIVWLHMRQQKMLESVKGVKQRPAQGLVIYTLAVMWPLLLLAMTLTYFQQKKRPSKDATPRK
jgi:hypothetical protein